MLLRFIALLLVSLVVFVAPSDRAHAGSRSVTLAASCPTDASIASLGGAVASVTTGTYSSVYVGIKVPSGADTFRLKCRSGYTGNWWTIGDMDTSYSDDPQPLFRWTVGSIFTSCVVCRVGGSVTPSAIEVMDSINTN
jgi:hypothetical protein